MTQQTDIVLNGAGYMIAPTSRAGRDAAGYTRLQDGYPEGLSQRTSITDFFGGQNRALQLERDTFAKSLRIGPALGGQGVVPWPTAFDLASSGMTGKDMPSRDQHIPHAHVDGFTYFAVGKTLYRQHMGDHIDWGPSVVKTYTHVITDLTIYVSKGLLIAFGSAAELLHRNTVSGVEGVLFSGDRAHKVQSFNGFAIWSDARTTSHPIVLRMVTGSQVQFKMLSYDIIDIATIGGDLLIVTKEALYTYSGHVREILVPNPAYDPNNPSAAPLQIPAEEWSDEFQPYYQQGSYTTDQDFSFVAGYGGKTLAWIAGGIHELTPSGDRAGWRSTGLTGQACFGGTVSGGYVVVSIQSHDNQNEIWAYDGNGWWRIATQPMPSGSTGLWINPINVVATRSSGMYNVFVFTEGTNNIMQIRLAPSPGHPYTIPVATPSTAEFVSPMIDAGDRDKIKAWRKLGIVFASPEIHGNQTSTDSVGINLHYSIDAGKTWILAASTTTAIQMGGGGGSLPTPITLDAMNFALEHALSGVTSRFIMIRVQWTSLNDTAPILAGAWVEHEALQQPARRRKWNLKIHARDQEIQRDGTTLTRTGRQLIDELWTAWETDTPLTFRDIDYDDDPVQRTVRIVGISEVATQPFDHGMWGDSHITLNLVEV